MNAATLIFPHQLYRLHPAVDRTRTVYLVEEILFFKQFNFHKQKLILHRATMKMYQAYLEEQNIPVIYIDTTDERSDVRILVTWLAAQGCREIFYSDVTDDWLRKRIATKATALKIKTVVADSPNFLHTLGTGNEYFNTKKNYLQTDFYIWGRKQLKLLLHTGNKPEGGKWTYDEQNRLKYPRTKIPPNITFPQENPFVAEAREYIDNHFPNNYGKPTFEKDGLPVFYPTTFEEAETWLDNFLEHRFLFFGDYQDAMVANAHFLHHSVLTPMLNTGLLSPAQIITRAVKAAPAFNVSLHSLEGFLRQILGWREFIRIVYEREGVRQRTTNYWQFTRKIPHSFWSGSTGIVPVDNVIKKLLATGYSHHIERLMVMANFMLLCEFDPDEVYRWFMEMYIDSYDWVMVPNVYGMTQFADGGLMATKPYISGSNYIMKMSDYKRGPWNEIWDGLFWRFMHVHRDFFEKNPRLGMLLKTFDKMPALKRKTHLDIAEKYLASLDVDNPVTQPSMF